MQGVNSNNFLMPLIPLYPVASCIYDPEFHPFMGYISQDMDYPAPTNTVKVTATEHREIKGKKAQRRGSKG